MFGLFKITPLRKAALLTGGFLLLILANIYGIARVYDAGGDARQDKILLGLAEAENKALKAAADKTTNIYRGSQKNEDAIIQDAKSDDNLGISDTLRNQLKRMHQDREIQAAR